MAFCGRAYSNSKIQEVLFVAILSFTLFGVFRQLQATNPNLNPNPNSNPNPNPNLSLRPTPPTLGKNFLRVRLLRLQSGHASKRCSKI